MNENDLIPSSYDAWRECITIRCRIKLTESFIQSRLAELEQHDHAKTREFEKFYGPEHLQRTIAWYRRAASELAKNPSRKLA